MKKIKMFLTIIALAIIPELLLSQLHLTISMGIIAVFGFCIFFSTAYFLLIKFGKHVKPFHLGGYFLAVLVLFELLINLFQLKPALVQWPVFLIHLSGIVAGMLFHQWKTLPLGVKLIAFGIALEFFVGQLRGSSGMRVSSICGFIAFLMITYALLKKYCPQLKPHQVTAYFLLGLLAVQLPIRIFNFTNTLISLPDFLVHALGVFAGYFFYERKRIIHTINLSVSVLIVLFVYFYGYDLWMNKVDYGSFNTSVYYEGPAHIILKDKHNEAIKLEKGKLMVMDFWFVSCASCFNEFPSFQKVYTSYKNNPKVQFYSVNQPFPSDVGIDRFKILTDMGYTFPMAVTPDHSLTKELEIGVYPTIVVLAGDGHVLYKGDIKDLDAAIKSNL